MHGRRWARRRRQHLGCVKSRDPGFQSPRAAASVRDTIPSARETRALQAHARLHLLTVHMHDWRHWSIAMINKVDNQITTTKYCLFFYISFLVFATPSAQQLVSTAKAKLAET